MKGKGKGGPPKLPSAEDSGPWSSFPVSKDIVNDLTTKWPVKGELREIPTEEEFTSLCEELPNVPVRWKPINREVFNGLAGWKQKQVIEELQRVILVSYKFPHHEVTPLESLHQADWSKVVGVQRSPTGSEGVIFIEFADKKAVCVKAPVKVAAEMYGTLVCKRMDIKCPDMLIVKISTDEGQRIVNSITNCPTCDATIEKMLKGKTSLLIVEYLQSVELADQYPPHSTEWAKNLFNLDSDKNRGQLSDSGKKALQDIGRLVAFDMITNNFDRLPCIWDNMGNPGNVMFKKTTNEAVSIDNMVCCIGTANENLRKVREKYLTYVHNVAYSLTRRYDREHRCFRRIRKFLRDGCVEGHGWPGLGIEVGRRGTMEMQSGFITAVMETAEGESSDSGNGPISAKEFEDFRTSLLEYLPDTVQKDNLQNVHICGFESIDCSFNAAVVEAFRTGLADARDNPWYSNQVLMTNEVAAGMTNEVALGAPETDNPSADTSVLEAEEVLEEEEEEKLKIPLKIIATMVMAAGKLDRGMRQFASLKMDDIEVPLLASEDDQTKLLEDLKVMHFTNQAAAEPEGISCGISRQNSFIARQDSLNERAAAKFLRQTSTVGAGSTFDKSLLMVPKPDEGWPEGVDPTRREQYLSSDDFMEIFGMDLKQFQTLPVWKGRELKRKAGLF